MSTSALDENRQAYGIAHWGGGYFDINDRGHATVTPSRDAAHGRADLAQLAADIQAEGLSLPVLVRFTGILR
ncbi:MAG: arginine decarboxylase, partial [Gammaproteobacteria bacterium]